MTDLRQQFERDGFVCPLPVLSTDEARALVTQLQSAEQQIGTTLGKAPGQLRAKSHLLFPWLYKLCFHPAIVAPIQRLFGPDLLLYHVTCWLKEPGDESYVSWHQDGTYFYLEPAEHVTAWIALTDSTLDSGCVEVIPGSHKLGQLHHDSRPDRENLLSNGQHAKGSFNLSEATPLALQAGEMSLHDTFIVHSSGPNSSPNRRIGIGLSYVPTHVQYQGGERVTATLVSGVDRYKHFDEEVAPDESVSPKSTASHASACAKFFATHGAAREGA
jgi:non-haem Fe2+, alpha-ketoglutarate-dependent halogenase